MVEWKASSLVSSLTLSFQSETYMSNVAGEVSLLGIRLCSLTRDGGRRREALSDTSKKEADSTP